MVECTGANVFAVHGGTRQLVEQMPTRGFQSSVDPRLHLGLGRSATIDSLTIVWPDGRWQTLTDVAAAAADAVAAVKPQPQVPFRRVAALTGGLGFSAWALRDDRYAVMCVKHDHNPTEDVKFLGEKQTRYQKKNWSSVMLFNCAQCKALTPDYVNTASGLELHQFKWLTSDEEIGALLREL